MEKLAVLYQKHDPEQAVAARFVGASDFRRDILKQPDSTDITRFPESLPKRDPSLERFVKIFRPPYRTVHHFNNDGSVQNKAGWIPSMFNRRSIYKGLEGTAWLSGRIYGQIVLILIKIAAPDEYADQTTGCFHEYHG